MRTRTALATGLVGLLAAGSLAPAVAAPAKPKPIKKSYQATASTPDPTPFAGEICDPQLPGAKHEAPFTIPYAGTLTVKIHSFQGDWALGLLDKDGGMIASHDNDVLAGDAVDSPSEVIVKFKKPTTVTVRGCNFAGGPTATVDITYVAK